MSSYRDALAGIDKWLAEHDEDHISYEHMLEVRQLILDGIKPKKVRSKE